MSSSPGFSKPTHGYGIQFGLDIELSSPEAGEIDSRLRDVYDQLMEEFGPSPRDEKYCGGCADPWCKGPCPQENWAGKGFEKPYEES